jgi:hypothetical protein
MTKVKKKHIITGLLLLTIAVVAYFGFAPMQTEVKAADQTLITVMNPAITSEMANREPLSPRLKTLDGKTIYMVDISWGGPDAARVFFEEMTAWFKQNMPTVKTVIKRKTGMYTMDDPRLWQEIKQNADAAIIGVSG